ncbi:LysR substrate-binding domain-containing protein [Vibrio porteresiae]|uniref:LysR substrate-binding domain-containing protein n=1 Tax=Vibrio porteresiae TaxID=435912 RepID=UPI0021C44506|nr:LysR substrate-binding domain-containing protein [Vibrio porteresiae]
MVVKRVKVQVTSVQQTIFIHNTKSLEFIRPDEEWNYWLEHQSDYLLKDIDVLQNNYIINHCDMTMCAAEADMGMTMARYTLVKEILNEGTLIAPFERVKSRRGYDLICPLEHESRPKTRAFIEWLNDHVKKEQ